MTDRRREKVEAIVKIFENNACELAHYLIILIDILIEEHRVANDDADGSELVRNQGKITALKDLRNYVLKGVPPKGSIDKLNLI